MQTSGRRGTSHPARAWLGALLVAVGLTAAASASPAVVTWLAQSSGPAVASDKADYAPGETAHITGSGFVPGVYAIPIKRPDGSFVKADGTSGWDTVTADAAGGFVYDYPVSPMLGTNEVRVYPASWLGDWSAAPLASTTFTDAKDPEIVARDHEGQSKIMGVPGGYSNGNVTTYAEGDFINFRFTLQGDANTTGVLEVRFTEDNGSCLFFDNFFSLGTWNGSAPAIEPISGGTPTVSIVSGPVAVDSGTSQAEWVVQLSVSFTASGTARVNYHLKLSDEAGQCGGSSQGTRLRAAGGAMTQTGAQNVPVSANQVVERPEITVTKQIDRDGNGTFESTAAAGEYRFCLDAPSGPCALTNSAGQVVFTNVSPDGAHSVTEQQVDFTQGTYEFDSGTGTNCVFAGSTATATVQSGTTPVNASCTFRNKARAGRNPSITVQKTASPSTVSEPGGQVTFTVTVTNTSPEPEAVTLTSLTDNAYGNLDKDDVGNHTWTSSTCDTGGTIAIGASYTCTFIAQVTGNAGTTHTNTVTATVVDDDGNEASASGSATVTIAGVAPTVTVEKTAAPTSRPEPGGSFTFTVRVTNTSAEPVTLTSLTDDVYGNLDRDDLVGHTWTSSTCDTGGTIAAGATYECSFTGSFTGNAGATQTDTITATVVDDDGSVATAEGSATVSITDVAPTVSVTKTATPSSVPETGGAVTYTVDVENTSSEAVTLDTLVDSAFGDLNGRGTCTTGGSIAAGTTYTCAFTVTLSGEPSSPHENTVTATVSDDDGSTASDSDSATVTFTDVAPTVDVTKSASPTSVPESGGAVTYTVTVTNTSLETVTVVSLFDDRFGNLHGQGTCMTGATVAPGGTYSCTFTQTVSGEPATPHQNTVTATVRDNDGSTGSDTGSAVVTFTDVAPTVDVTKSASPSSVPESGGAVTFTIAARNTSFESVTLETLLDSRFGSLHGQGTCSLPQTLAPGATYQCQFTANVSGEPASPHENTVTATVRDNDGSTGTDSATATVTFTDVPPTIEVTKTPAPASVPESGGVVTFTVMVENTSFESVTLETLVDDRFGNLNGQGSCTTGVTIAAGVTYSCTFAETLTGEPASPHVNTVTATVRDNDNSTGSDAGSATVTFTDVVPTVSVQKTADTMSVPESGGDVTFTVTVTNTSFEPVTLEALVDDQFGNLSGRGTCSVPQQLAPGETYQCTFTVNLRGEPGSAHRNTVTATVRDNEGTPGTGSGSATVVFTDVPPTVEVTKSAAPSSVPESGGDVTFTFTVENTSFEPVTLETLVDSRFGNLDGRGTCSVPQTLAPGATYQCAVTTRLSGEPGAPHTNTVTATVRDNDNSTGSGSDSATVTFTDVAPTVEVTKTASPTSVNEPGGAVTFTIDVKNTSFEPVTLVSLADDQFGNLFVRPTCTTGAGTVIAPGATYSCSFTAQVTGNGNTTHRNTATATVQDNEGTQASDSDSATVTIADVPPTAEVTKTAAPSTVFAPAGTVTFTVTVRNTSGEPVVLVSLVDDKFGNLDGKGTCDVPQNLAPGAVYSCSFTAIVQGPGGTTHTNTVTATVRDDEGNNVRASGSATVTILALPDGTAKMTGGGQIVPIGGEKATFGLIAQVKNGIVSSGHFNYVNHTTRLHLNGPVTLIFDVDPTAHRLSFLGTALNGCTFVVTVQDNGESGTRGPDRFSLTASCPAPNPEAVNAPLVKGNLQWHPTQG